MDQHYPIIAEHILSMIPNDNWKEIYLYAEILDGSREVYFYFNTFNDEEFIYSHDIPEKYRLSEKKYNKLLLELQERFEELRQIFIKNDQESWTNLTFILKHPGKLKIHYDYEDVIASEITSTQRQMIFEYQYLGLLPEKEKNKQFVENYLKSHENN